MPRPIAKVSPKSLKEDDQNSIRKARSPVDRPLRKTILAIREKVVS